MQQVSRAKSARIMFHEKNQHEKFHEEKYHHKLNFMKE